MNPTTPGDGRLKNSDLAFTGDYVIQGNYSGYQIWNVANPAKPMLTTAYVCPGSQSDVSVYGNLMFVSHESTAGRIDCGLQGVPDTVSADRARGVRIYDITDISRPRMIKVVQTCRGSHTHTVVSNPKDDETVYIYVSGTSGVRSANELPGCTTGALSANENTAQFRIEVIKVPLKNPERAAVVGSPRIVRDLAPAPRNAARDTIGARGRGGRGGVAGGDSAANAAAAAAAAAGRGGRGGRGGTPAGPTGCHDITVYPAMGLAGGACGGYGLLLDITNVENPTRIYAAADSNFAFWHSATFSNDASKVLFTDEWGGGSAPRCRASDRYEWGANAIFTIVDRKRLDFQSYYKMPAAQSDFENCVAHNGSLIPVPGREIMVQSWYQGGISIFDWTDPKRPVEIGYYDQGPLTGDKLVAAGHWSTYWHNGLIYSSDEARGLVIFELTPSPMMTANEIEAAKLVRFAQMNVQDQQKLVWPAHFAVARSYVDQLARSGGLPATRIRSVRNELARAESLTGGARRAALIQVLEQLYADVAGSSDAGKVRMLAGAVKDLAGAAR
ncbi:MAG TPA: hypothetical protein VFO55_01525 [Gemmatimonadaceae bacterium]|nr:hypothetical protein [Gemmatimonadaceae bacterium]